jgi:hypothetical protein
MKMQDTRHDLEIRAAAALQAALTEVSAIKVREIRHQSVQDSSLTGSARNLMVHVDVFGRRHTLACQIQTEGDLQCVRSTLEELRASATHRGPDETPIIIAPRLSAESQALCRESMTGFVDLEGNARFALGEVFVIKRTLPHRSHRRALAAPARYPAPSAVEKFPIRGEASLGTVALAQA